MEARPQSRRFGSYALVASLSQLGMRGLAVALAGFCFSSTNTALRDARLPANASTMGQSAKLCVQPSGPLPRSKHSPHRHIPGPFAWQTSSHNRRLRPSMKRRQNAVPTNQALLQPAQSI